MICGRSEGTPVSSTNKAVRRDITEILLKVALNTITLTRTQVMLYAKKCPLDNEILEHIYNSQTYLRYN